MTSKRTGHSQDIAYFLGDSTAAEVGAQECLFQVQYSDADFVDASSSPARMGIAMQTQSCAVDLVENWYGANKGERRTGALLDGELHYIEQGDEILIFGALGCLEEVEASSFRAYGALLDHLHQNGFHTLVRSWNFIPQINHCPKGELEIYRDFCKGRAQAFDACGIDEFQLPAATGIGCYSRSIMGYLVASRRADYLHVENPLQSPAYKYPPKYGPRSPSFARGTLHLRTQRPGSQSSRFYLSGTASCERRSNTRPR